MNRDDAIGRQLEVRLPGHVVHTRHWLLQWARAHPEKTVPKGLTKQQLIAWLEQKPGAFACENSYWATTERGKPGSEQESLWDDPNVFWRRTPYDSQDPC